MKTLQDFKVVLGKDIFDRLPKFVPDADQLLELKVAWCEGDAELDSLDLDYDHFMADEDISLIFVEGNLTVKGNIYNENTDSAIALIVLGDLHCKNAAFGGQIILVHGDFYVTDVVCGSYNHGQAIVLGDLVCGVLVYESDEYHWNVFGAIHAGERLVNFTDDEEWEPILCPPDLFLKDVEKDIFCGSGKGNKEFNFYGLHSVLQKKSSLLARNIDPLSDSSITHTSRQRINSCFSNLLITTENLNLIFDNNAVKMNPGNLFFPKSGFNLYINKVAVDDAGNQIPTRYIQYHIPDGDITVCVYPVTDAIDVGTAFGDDPLVAVKTADRSRGVWENIDPFSFDAVEVQKYWYSTLYEVSCLISSC